MKILVTGANGYIGLHIVKTLLDKGIQVIACDLNTDEVDKRAERKNIDLFTLPDTNIYTLLGTPDVVYIWLGAMDSYTMPQLTWEIYRPITDSLLE